MTADVMRLHDDDMQYPKKEPKSNVHHLARSVTDGAPNTIELAHPPGATQSAVVGSNSNRYRRSGHAPESAEKKVSPTPKDWSWSSFSFYSKVGHGLIKIDLVN
jgi:hypothetical protein